MALHRTLLTVVLLAVLLPFYLAAEKPADVPNPKTARDSFVQDSGGVLGPGYVSLIDGVCRSLKSASGIELAVVTVADLGGLTVEEYAEELYRRFGVGEKGKDNGLLLLFARDDRAVRLEVGYGLEGAMPDARASRLLDQYGVPDFKQGLIGRGLYNCARESALIVASAGGVSLNLPQPAAWPEQPAPPRPQAEGQPAATDGRKSGRGAYVFSLVLLGLVGCGILIALLRLGRQRARAGRQKAMSAITGFNALVWSAAGVGFFVLLASGSGFLNSLASVLAPTAAGVGSMFFSRFLRRRQKNYRLPCPACKAEMELVPEEKDNEQLAEEEAAEERAGGMDYEIWICPQCGKVEKLAVKLGKATACPKCKRRTLKSETTTLVQATTASGGRVRVSETCLNPKCGYSKVQEHSTARLGSSSSSSSGGGSRSSSGSFGGGRSGGGGASKHW